MDDFKTGEFNPLGDGDSPSSFSNLSKTEANLLDMDNFETLEAVINASEAFDKGEIVPPSHPMDDFLGNFQSGLNSAARPLVTGSDDDLCNPATAPVGNLLDNYVNIERDTALLDFTAAENTKQQHGDSDDELSIDSQSASLSQQSQHSREAKSISPPVPASHSFEIEQEEIITAAKIKASPEIETKADSHNYELGTAPAYKTTAQPTSKQSPTAMESEKAGSQNSDCDCPFSPGAWFNPEKLHPVVAEYVYWRDPKKSGIALTASLVFLFSFKFFSVISVAAYLVIAVLTITVSFRLYKNVLQAIQKSNEGHPFKDYLDMDIALSQDKVGETVESLIQHLNCASGKLRSLVMVEDLVDTIKLGILAWCLTYVGAWFNGLTLVILAVVSAFTLPKVYETNKTQIDAYAELVRTKGKEVIEMVNAKMPMGKKKKDQ